jgi:xanthine/uracil permease
MLMIASFSSGVLAILLALSIGEGSMLITSIPGFVVGGFFAFRYTMYNRSKAKEEEHKRSRNRRKH